MPFPSINTSHKSVWGAYPQPLPHHDLSPSPLTPNLKGSKLFHPLWSQSHRPLGHPLLLLACRTPLSAEISLRLPALPSPLSLSSSTLSTLSYKSPMSLVNAYFIHGSWPFPAFPGLMSLFSSWCVYMLCCFAWWASEVRDKIWILLHFISAHVMILYTLSFPLWKVFWVISVFPRLSAAADMLWHPTFLSLDPLLRIIPIFPEPS